MKRVLLILAASAAAILLLVLLGPRTDAPANARFSGLPWQIETMADGTARVFGVTLGASTLDDAKAVLGADMQLAIVAAPDEPGALEAFYDTVSIGPLGGKMVLRGDASDALIAAMRERAAKAEYMESTTRRFTLAAADQAQALQVPLAGVTFIPAAQLDEETVVQRFGPPVERVRITEHVEQLLYPAKGLAITLDGKGREVLQYVAPRDFVERIRKPLQAAGH